MSAGCPIARWQNQRPQPTPQDHGLADICLSRSLDQTAAGRNAGDGGHGHGGARRRRLRRDARRLVSAAAACRRASTTMADDFVAVAERFVGTPYLWGGKSSLGIDCSGLVQVSLNAAGTGCPRDSDMQQDGLGRDVERWRKRRLAARRSDLLERPCRDRARRRHHRSRQRPSHGDRDRKHPRGHRAHQGRRQRDHGDQAAG